MSDAPKRPRSRAPTSEYPTDGGMHDAEVYIHSKSSMSLRPFCPSKLKRQAIDNTHATQESRQDKREANVVVASGILLVTCNSWLAANHFLAKFRQDLLLPNIVQLFALLPHWMHFWFSPSGKGPNRFWSKGIHNDLAPAEGAFASSSAPLLALYVSFRLNGPTTETATTHCPLLLSLMSSSHFSCSHQGMTTAHLLSSMGTISSHLVTGRTDCLNLSLALSSISTWIFSR